MHRKGWRINMTIFMFLCGFMFMVVGFVLMALGDTLSGFFIMTQGGCILYLALNSLRLDKEIKEFNRKHKR